MERENHFCIHSGSKKGNGSDNKAPYLDKAEQNIQLCLLSITSHLFLDLTTALDLLALIPNHKDVSDLQLSTCPTYLDLGQWRHPEQVKEGCSELDKILLLQPSDEYQPYQLTV